MYALMVVGFEPRYLVETPPNLCTPTYLATAAKEIADKAPDVMSLRVLEKEECEALGMGCYLAVSACSAQPPKFIHLAYKPQGALPFSPLASPLNMMECARYHEGFYTLYVKNWCT